MLIVHYILLPGARGLFINSIIPSSSQPPIGLFLRGFHITCKLQFYSTLRPLKTPGSICLSDFANSLNIRFIKHCPQLCICSSVFFLFLLGLLYFLFKKIFNYFLFCLILLTPTRIYMQWVP